MSINSTILSGRLTADPELRVTNSGKSVTSFTLAVDKKADGDETADFFDIVVWGNTAEAVCKYTGKGSKVVVSGRLGTRKYEDKQGNSRKVVEVTAERVEFMDAKKAEPEIQTPAADDDELPF